MNENSPQKPETDRNEPRYLEIDTARKGRWLGWAGYVLFFLLVATAIVIVFVKFAGSVGLAVFLVAVMVGYMVLMGYVAGKNAEDRDR